MPSRIAGSEPPRARVQAVDVDVVAQFATVTLPLRNLMQMQIGDVLGIDLPRSITALVGGTALLDCTYGVRNGRYALRVAQVRTPERSTGEHHG